MGMAVSPVSVAVSTGALSGAASVGDVRGGGEVGRAVSGRGLGPGARLCLWRRPRGQLARASGRRGWPGEAAGRVGCRRVPGPIHREHGVGAPSCASQRGARLRFRQPRAHDPATPRGGVSGPLRASGRRNRALRAGAPGGRCRCSAIDPRLAHGELGARDAASASRELKVKPMSEDDTTTVQTDDKPDACPACGGDVYLEPRCVHGGPTEATSGWACTTCSWYRVHTPSSPEARTADGTKPDTPSVREGAVDLPRKRSATVADAGFDADANTYTLPDGCPECGGPLIYLLRRNTDAGLRAKAEYEAVAERCARYGDGCSHRSP